jgi:hypothetical protein
MPKTHKLTENTVASRTTVSGDPGVGGLLSDPLKTPQPHEQPNPNAGPASPDPKPPRHHGDWLPPQKDRSAAANGEEHPE